ncbi:urea carboxylase-associated family protein [Enterococcus sp. DIV0765a]|uniref:urea carboxylase-associated family protein n=1 Tax=Enterococcus sp. DIV0765a TaxID=2774828 RepID=UPI003D2E2D4F
MKNEVLISPCSGKSLTINQGQTVTIIDVEGGQVADFFAVNPNNENEFLSPGVTIDCNESIRLNIGDTIYSNIYNPMFTVFIDEVGKHDLLFPCCRPEMYDFFYDNGKNHPNCFDNINQSLGTNRSIIQPINLFMNTSIDQNGKITIHKPLSKPGSKITLKANMDMILGIAACSVSEANTNGDKNTSIRVIIE